MRVLLEDGVPIELSTHVPMSDVTRLEGDVAQRGKNRGVFPSILLQDLPACPAYACTSGLTTSKSPLSSAAIGSEG